MDVQQLLATLSREKQPLIHCAVFLELKTKSMSALESLQSDISMELTRSKITADRLTLRQKEGFLSAMPFGWNRFGSQFERVLPASAVGNMFPFNFSGKTDPKGFYIGRDKYGTNILVDLDRRGDDKTNSNVLILGNSGQGKSYLMKLLLTNLRESGKRVLVMDAEGEYGELAVHNGGCCLDFLDGQYMINILEPKVWASEPVEDPDAPEAFRRSGRISQHIAFLKDWFRSYKDFTDAEVDTIEIMLSQLYKNFGLTEKIDFTELHPEDYPILSDLYELCIQEYHCYDPKRKPLYTEETLRNICLGLNSVCVGSESRFFNGHTNIQDNMFLVFGVKGVMDLNKNGIQQAAELEPHQDVWDVGLPPARESDMDAMADPSYWMDRFQPRFAEPESEMNEPDPVDFEPEEPPPHRNSDSKEWWSDYYKLARKYLYGTKTEKPDFQKAMPLLLLEANRGNGYACYDLGRIHLMGQGCEEDEEEAQRWFRDALEAFHVAEASAEKKGYLRYRIGKCHAYGYGTQQNYEESARWFRQAVDENNPFAAYSLGGQHLRGQGVEQSDTEAYSLYHMAATHEKQPNAYAQYQLGKMCRDGIGTEVNLEESRLWYAKAYAGFLTMEETMADDRLYYRLGSMNMTGTGTAVDFEQARYYFEKAAELGNADALYGLGRLFLKPEFPDYDPAKAVEYLEESAAKGNAFAKYQLGKLLCQGELLPKDVARGLPLLEELAENGVTFASYIAGKVYLKEEGWQDIKKAILYFRQAAEDGNSFAEYQLGRIYYFGNGVRVDREKGLEYLKESAAHGNEYAANLLQTIQQQHTWGVASCATSLITQLGRIFQEQDQKQSQRQRPRMDRKHRREIEEKKQAMGIRD